MPESRTRISHIWQISIPIVAPRDRIGDALSTAPIISTENLMINNIIQHSQIVTGVRAVSYTHGHRTELVAGFTDVQQFITEREPK